MSYAICSVVCGCIIDEKLRDFIQEFGYEADDIGVITYYSSGGETPMVCGLELFEFDECKNLKASELIPKLSATPEQIEKATELLQAAREKLETLIEDDGVDEKELKKLIKKIPVCPEVVLVWSSS
jgi:hypothetical protein